MVNKFTKRPIASDIWSDNTGSCPDCATQQQSLYYWGDYQDQQYAYFKGDKGAADSILHLEKIREEAKASGQAVPPGLQAHLAMLYGQAGRTDKFEQNLAAEKQQFPECTSYLDFLLKKKQKTTP